MSGIFFRPRFGQLLAAAILTAAAAAVRADGGGIDTYERVQAVVTRRADRTSLRVVFHANGREYRLQLAPNPRLQRWSANGHWRQYQGVIEGNDKSWVRVAVAGESLRGVIFDGDTLLAMEPAEDGTVKVFRLSDLRLPAPLAFAGDSVRPPLSGPSSGAGSAAPSAEALVAGRELEVSVVTDAAFRARYGDADSARDAVLTRMNIVDGIFSAQVGTAIEVASIVDDEPGGSLGDSTDPPILLDSLGRLRQQDTSLNAQGLTHLFTGRDLDGTSVGIGYDGTLCRTRYSASLAQAHDSAAVDGLITAHEIGHVFGAPHDGEDACAATPQGQYIMSPVLNSQATSFSQCSLDQMAPLVESASCLAPLAPADLTMPASLGSHDALAGDDFAWRFEVTNQGGRTATGVRVTLQLTPAIDLVSATVQDGNCELQASLATCERASVAAGANAEVSVVVRGAAAGTFSAHARVTSADDASHSNDEADGTLRVQAASAAPPTPAPAAPARSGGGGALDFSLLGLLGVLLGAAACGRSIRAQ